MTTLTFKPQDIIQLYRAYMPFVLDGGFFIETENKFKLGDEVSLEMILPEETELQTYTGKIVWLAPKKMLTEHSIAGVGVQITDSNAYSLREKVEAILRDYLNSDQPTDTM